MVDSEKIKVMTSMVLLLEDARKYRGSLPVQLCYAKAACRLGVETGVAFETQAKPPASKQLPGPGSST